MKEALPNNTRRARRINARVRVRFSINGGPVQTSDTLNFTLRSLAIRSAARVRKGDTVLAHIDRLPPLHGAVIRVFDEGFAMSFDQMSKALFAHISANDRRAARALAQMAGARPGRMVSPFFRLAGPLPAWGRLATSRPKEDDLTLHFFSIIADADLGVDAFRSVWASVGQSRWLARVKETSRRGEQDLIVILLNDWQLRLAARDGLQINFVGAKPEETAYQAPAGAVRRHLQLLKNARTGEPRPAHQRPPERETVSA